MSLLPFSLTEGDPDKMDTARPVVHNKVAITDGKIATRDAF